MIKPNFIIGLFVVLVFFVMGYFLISSDRPLIETVVSAGSLILKDAKLANVTEIHIKKDDVQIKIELQDKRWILTSHKNRPALADRVLTLLNDTCSARVEGSRDGKPTLFALDEKNTTELVLVNAGQKYPLYLGKSTNLAKSFVRSEKDGTIYEVDRALDYSAGVRVVKDVRQLEPSSFYDLNLLSLPIAEIIDIQIEKGKDSAHIRRAIVGKEPLDPKQSIPKDAKLEWQIVAPEKMLADDAAVSRITSQFIRLNIKRYTEDISDVDSGLDTPTAKISLKMKDGSSSVLTFGKTFSDADKTDAIYVALEGRADRFILGKFTFDAMSVPLEELKKKAKPDDSKSDPKASIKNSNSTPKAVEAHSGKLNPSPLPPPPPPKQKEVVPAPPPAEAPKSSEPPPAVVK